ncbi:MAG TPA: Xaa-Pro peptidase family protein [Acidobacteriaceae bacterium]|nr:Xaa-Pro peptidase family protein [Acidobacteriaceae bacterium]
MRGRLALLLLLLAAQAAYALESVPMAEYRQRRVKLGAELHGGSAVIFAAYEPSAEYQDYRQDEDFYYLTGSNEPGGALLIIGDGPATTTRLGPLPAHAYREILFLPTRDPIREKYTGAKIDAATPGASHTLGVDEVMPLSSLPAVYSAFLAQDPRERAKEIWTQQDMSVAAATLSFTSAVLGTDDPIPPHDVRDLTMQLRMVKSPAEIELIRKATDASIAAQLAGMRAIKPGVRERTIAGVEVGTMLAEGCERVSYPAIVGSGINSTTLHYSENSKLMESGDVVVIDAAGEYSMYASDLTRTMPVDGHFSERQKEIYSIVLGAQQAARAAFVAGKSKMGSVLHRGADADKDSLDKVAFDYINTHGKDLHGAPLGKYFLHTLGHSVGIDVHDPYDYDKPFAIGSVFTIEPGIYIPEEKIGVRIEDTFYVNAEGKLIDFAEKLPHTPEEVEAAMHGGQ